MMHMIPSEPLSTCQSQAEKKVFEQLRGSFLNANQGGWFAMHSLNLPRHDYKRFGEIDFLICGADGIFVIEVKGGSVSCRNGVWETINRYNEIQKLTESPFKQAESALHGLRKKLPRIDRFVIGYGVVMPDVDRLADSSEWDRAVLADSHDFRQFESWLSRFFKHWREKNSKKLTIGSEELKILQQELRPDFEAVMPLHVFAHDVESRIVQLTHDQLNFIDAIEDNKRVICSGGAGTGKTMMAIELAKRWGARGMKTVLACHSPWLKSYLEAKAVAGLTVTLVNSVKVAARRAGIEKFDALIADEGQDILNMDALDYLDSCLFGGLNDGRWCFFHDINNQTGLCGTYLPEAYEYLESMTPTKIPLKTNCRNSRPILKKIQASLKADLGNPSVGNGPETKVISVKTRQDATKTLENELRSLIIKEGFNWGNITILSKVPFLSSCAFALPPDLVEMISILDDNSPRNENRTLAGFAEINNFKGLESEVVLLIDLPAPEKDKALQPYHYVGMSRARALLRIIYYDP